jgi:WD40 repeat protein
VVGDDKASRELFDLILRSQKSVSLLEEIAEAKNPEPPLAHWYFARRDELYEASRKPSDKVPGVFEHVPIPDEDIAGWLLLGTYLGTKVAPKNDVSLIFLTNIEGDKFTEAMSEECSFSKPLRKLFGAWLANRGDDLHAYYDGLPYALRFDIPESLATARRILKYYSEIPKERRENFSVAYVRIMCLLVIGERGTKDDLPLVESCFDDRAIGIYTRGGDQLKEKPDSVQVRDVAASVAIHLCGGKPREFGLTERAKNRWTDRFGLWNIVGFASDAEREPVHKAAREWLDKHMGPPYGPVKTLTAPAEVGALAFIPKSEKLLVCSQDFSVQTWDTSTGNPISNFRAGAEGSVAVGVLSGLSVSPDGKRMAVRYFVADQTGKFLFGLEGHVAEITRINYDRYGRRILTSSWDGTIRIWEGDTGKLLRTIDAHMGRKVVPGPQTGVGSKPMGSQPERFEGRGVRDAAFSPNGNRIVSGGVDGAIRIWDAETGKVVWGGKVSQSLMAVAYLPYVTQVVSGEQEGTIRIWDANDGKEVKKLTGHTEAVTCLAVTPDGKQLVSAACDNTVRVWDLESGRELRCFRGHTKWVYAIAISPDGKTVASGGEDRVVRIWAMP